jgi:molybdate transport system substrate-binding protein
MPKQVLRRLALAALTLSAACGSAGSADPAGARTAGLAGRLTVFAAASLTSSFTELGKDFESAHPGTTITFSFGPSSGLAQQILAGAPADVFAAASAKSMSQVSDAGEATGVETFARNVAEIAVSLKSARKVTTLTDLGKPGVKVALCQPEVPCGALAQQVLAAAKLTVRPVTQGLDVKSTLAYVTSDQVDAAIVYVTDVRVAKGKVLGVQVPAALNASTAYQVATVTSSKSAALATAFERYVLSAAGQRVLRAAGFVAP